MRRTVVLTLALLFVGTPLLANCNWNGDCQMCTFFILPDPIDGTAHPMGLCWEFGASNSTYICCWEQGDRGCLVSINCFWDAL